MITLDKYVAPYVGAWIETPPVSEGVVETVVAPYVGAWIETSMAVSWVS